MSQISNPQPNSEALGFDLAEIHPNITRGTDNDDLIIGNFQSEQAYNQALQNTASEILADASFSAAITDAILSAPNAAVVNTAFDVVDDAKAAMQAIGTAASPADATVQAILSLNTAIKFFQTNNLNASELLATRAQLANSLGVVIDALGGNDIVASGVGYDEIFGGNGNDYLFGNQGKDTIAGGQGNDTIFGGKDDDLILGGQGDDYLSGDFGNDSIFGNKDNDTLFGGEGNDSVFGGQGNDVIFGGQGNDVVSGDKGNDSLFGGEGQDTFRFGLFLAGGGAIPTAAEKPLGMDSIGDFNPTEDKIQLDRCLFPELNSDTLLANDFAKINSLNDLNNPANQGATIVYDSSSGLVYYNATDAAGDEVEVVKLQSNLNLSADNFNSF
jgi:serralysin